MITDGILDFGMNIMDLLFSFIGVLPDIDPRITNAIDEYFNFMFSGINLIGVFIDVDMLKILIPIVIAIIRLDDIIKILMWVIKKIPFVDMK